MRDQDQAATLDRAGTLPCGCDLDQADHTCRDRAEHDAQLREVAAEGAAELAAEAAAETVTAAATLAMLAEVRAGARVEACAGCGQPVITRPAGTVWTVGHDGTLAAHPCAALLDLDQAAPAGAHTASARHTIVYALDRRFGVMVETARCARCRQLVWRPVYGPRETNRAPWTLADVEPLTYADGSLVPDSDRGFYAAP